MSKEYIEELNLEVLQLKKQTENQEVRIRSLEKQISKMKEQLGLDALNKPLEQKSSEQPQLNAEQKLSLPFMSESETTAQQQVQTPLENFGQQRSLSDWNFGDWEELLGGTLLNRLGIIALILALIFFFKYAFDNNWIGNTGKVILGIVFGVSLLGAGEHFRSKGLHKFAYGFTGGGLASLYASIYAAYQFYSLLGHLTAFAAMIAVTVTGIGLSLHHNSPAISALAVLGGFFTPFMLPTAEANAVGLFAYITFLNLIVLGVSLKRRWRYVHSLGFILTTLLTVFWIAAGYKTEQLGIMLIFTTVSFLLYIGVTLFYSLQAQETDKKYDIALLIANPTVYFLVLYSLLNDNWHNYMGFLAAGLALLYLLFGYQVWKEIASEKVMAQLFLAVSACFLTIAVPLQFSGYTVTIFWVMEAIFIWYAGLLIKDNKIRLIAGIVGILALLHLWGVDTEIQLWNLKSFTPIFNSRGFSYLFTAAVAALAYNLYQRFFPSLRNQNENEHDSLEPKLVRWLPVLAVFLAFSLFTMDISSFCDFRMLQVSKKVEAIYSAANQQSIAARELALQNVQPLEDKRVLWSDIQGLSVSGLWLLSALGFLFFGLKRSQRFWRTVGLSLLAIVTLKVFAFDLSDVLFNSDWLGKLSVYWPLINKRAVTIIVLAAAFQFVNLLYKKMNPYNVIGESAEKQILKWLPAAAILLTAFLFTSEVDSFWQYKIVHASIAVPASQQTAALEQVSLWRNAKQVSISVLWALFSLVFIVYGLKYQQKYWRAAGIALLGIVLLKVFFNDLANLNILYRIITFTCLGGLMLLASYFYQGRQRNEL